MKISMVFNGLRDDPYFAYLLKEPGQYTVLFRAVAKRLSRAAAVRLFPSHILKLISPPDFDSAGRKRILDRINGAIPVEIPATRLYKLPALELAAREGSVALNDINIPLATMDVPLKSTFFEVQYDDREDSFAANRFIWLYHILLLFPCQNVLAHCFEIILEWIKQNRIPEKNAKFETYSICERLIAWALFFAFTGKHLSVDRTSAALICESIKAQLLFTMRHLEYHGPLTNNHILNNARALYMVGRLFGLHDVSELGREIFSLESPNFIKDGILQEGSSHYQFLLTKNILEMHLVASLTKDHRWTAYLGNMLDGMLRVCDGLQSKHSAQSPPFPLIGDISPDMTPDWFEGYPFSRNTRIESKWFALFRYSGSSFTGSAGGQERPAKNDPKMKWHCLRNADFEVWVNIRTGKIPGHGHNDNGSVVVYYRGNPVVVDLGQVSYQDRVEKQKQAGVCAHNTPALNGFAPDITQSSILFQTTISSKCQNINFTENGIRYTIVFANTNMQITRSVWLEACRCCIKDENTRAGSKSYRCFWHFFPDVMRTGNSSFACDDLVILFESNQPIKSQWLASFYRSESYGRKAPVKTVCAESQLKKSDNLVLCISPKETNDKH